jgi:rhamnose utilization protein RhaD (predicted bifunctional aldolase and dehydrogenase)
LQNQIAKDLLALSHELGREDRGLVILGEGNTSARLGAETFLVKASGSSLASLKAEELVECRFAPLLPLLKRSGLSDRRRDAAVLAARVDRKAGKPSVETLFHAYLLSLPEVNFVGHAHPTTVNQILCSPRARRFAEQRMFPFEVIACGVASVLVPYTPSGLPLAVAVRRHTESFLRKHRRPPGVILLKSHGVIALGPTAKAVLTTLLVLEKAAKIFIGATALGGPVFFPRKTVEEIFRKGD